MPSPTFNPQLDTPAARMFGFFRMAKEHMFSAKPPHSASFLDIAILSVAAERNNPSMKDIVDKLHIAGPSATVIIDRLVEKGELVRTEDADDRRVVRLAITDEGKKTLKSGMKECENGMSQILSVLEAKEQAEFDRIITKIITQK